MSKVSLEHYRKAMDNSSEVFGVDPAYFGEEGAAEVKKQLKNMGYTDEDLKEIKDNF